MQDFATYNAAGGEPVGCYIKVKTDAVGNAGIVKTAEDGKVEGLQFQITGSDGSSTTRTTDADGNIDIDGLPIYAADGSKITYTATEVNARIAGISDKVGTVEAGKEADLLFTVGNPLESLLALRYPKMVMARGQLVREPKVKKMPEVEEALDKYL